MDLHIRIEVSEGSQKDLSDAIKEMQSFDDDFPPMTDGREWWHKPPDNARAILARCLSRHGLTGRLSVEPHDEVSDWNVPPQPRWTGFTRKKLKEKRKKKDLPIEVTVPYLWGRR